MNDKMTKEELKALRKKHNITQKCLSDMIYVSVTAVANWEQGKVTINKNREQSIMNALQKLNR